VQHLSQKTGTDAAKIRGEILHLNNSKSVWKNYVCIFQNTKNYLFHYCIFQLDWIIDFRNGNKIIKIFACIQTVSADRFWPMQTGCSCHCIQPCMRNWNFKWFQCWNWNCRIWLLKVYL